MTFHEHGAANGLSVLWQCHLDCHYCPGKFKNLVHAHIYIG